ncbi:hypothetical protein TELCIR_15204 [Teladorsagia circumcincta]|uniref:Uncharacterized protein n=1 Tax=Teladorsagia circumcincta TaxID=45464 RepID=A0A2G9TZ61_TELCI|nr:hypothetical protein TELCIR_15204 [Teladorsagia circumcincta]
MTVLTDVFGNRLVWENDLHHVAEEALEFSERMAYGCFGPYSNNLSVQQNEQNMLMPARSSSCASFASKRESSEDNVKDDDDHLLACLLTRHFDPRRMADAAARMITTKNGSILMQKCMKLYVSPKRGDNAEEALSLMAVLTDVFGNRLVWENDLHHVAEEALEFSERMSEIVSLFNQIELQHKQTERKREEEESQMQYKIEKISLPRRTLNW